MDICRQIRAACKQFYRPCANNYTPYNCLHCCYKTRRSSL